MTALTPSERRELTRLIESGEPLPEKWRGRLFPRTERKPSIGRKYPLISEVVTKPNKRLLVRFRNGVTKLYDCRRILSLAAFKPLRNNAALFQLAHADKHGYGIV